MFFKNRIVHLRISKLRTSGIFLCNFIESRKKMNILQSNLCIDFQPVAPNVYHLILKPFICFGLSRIHLIQEHTEYIIDSRQN